jgi:4-aminobutyrate---pyruvate transaminase
VICGFGRLGTMFGSESFGLQPDMIAMAKQLSAAYQPISALMVNEKVHAAIVAESEKIGTFGHGFTYSGHPVATAVALETLKIYEERDIVGHVKQVAPLFQRRLHALSQHPLVGNARGRGLIGTLELVRNKETKEPFKPADAIAVHAGKRAQVHGVVTRALGDNYSLCPPLIITEAQINDMFDRSERALDDTYTWARANNLY